MYAVQLTNSNKGKYDITIVHLPKPELAWAAGLLQYINEALKKRFSASYLLTKVKASIDALSYVRKHYNASDDDIAKLNNVVKNLKSKIKTGYHITASIELTTKPSF